MEQKQQEDPFLFVLLGFDTLYSINLNHLLRKEDEEADLQIVFSHKTHKQVPGSGKPYPLGMGLFVYNSKLHFFGGQNMKAEEEDGFQNINFEISKDPPKQLEYHPAHDFLYGKNLDQGINEKVFSFTPTLKSDEPALSLVEEYITECDFPSHLSYKMRPAIVFTISDKVYALSARPFSGIQIYNGGKEEQDVFQVFEPCNINNGIIKWQWTKLPNPPFHREKLFTAAIIPPGPIFHCVFKNQLFLQTPVGKFIFDLNRREWLEIECDEHDMILASLEYKGQLLLFYGDGYLVAYDYESFQEYKEDVYFWRSSSSFGACWEETIFEVETIIVWGASLSIVDDNSICLVFKGDKHLHVCHFEFNEPLRKFGLKASQEFHLPPVMSLDRCALSSFIINVDVGKSNQDSTTTGSLHLEGKSHLKRKIISFEDEMEGTCSMEEY